MNLPYKFIGSVFLCISSVIVGYAQPTLSVNPSAGTAGISVTLVGSGYTPGGYTASILWDGATQTTFIIPQGGSFKQSFTLPFAAKAGKHTITVCAGSPCFTGEFAQTASTTFLVGSSPLINRFTPLAGPVGTEVTIIGNYFSELEEVRFGGPNGGAADFDIVHDDTIKAIVPLNAITGNVWVGNAFGAATSNQIFTVCTFPNKPSTISGNNSVCVGSAEEYSVKIENNAKYIWSISGGGSLSSKGNIATVAWGKPGKYEIKVVPENSCGEGPERTLEVTVGDVPAQPSQIQEDKAVCAGQQTYRVNNVNGVQYQWEVSGGGEMLDDDGNEVRVVWEKPGTYTLTVTPSNGCGEGELRSLSVAVEDVPTQLSTIQGEDEVCVGMYEYSVSAVDNISYQWEVSGGGKITGSGRKININWTETGSYELSVTPVNDCGEGPGRTLTVIVSNVPAKPATIEGDEEVCLGSSLYSVKKAEGVTYQWSVSEGGSITNTNDNEIQVNWTDPGNHTITVLPANSCGKGAARQVSVTVKDFSKVAGNINGTADICPGPQKYKVSPEDGVTYNWSLSEGGSITQRNNHEITVNWTSPGEHTVSVLPENECGQGTAKDLKVKVSEGTPKTTGHITGGEAVCTGEHNYSVNALPAVQYRWKVSEGGTISGAGNEVTVNWTAPGKHTITVIPFTNCGDGPASTLTVQVGGSAEKPGTIDGKLEVCLENEEVYTVPAMEGVKLKWKVVGGKILETTNSRVKIQWTTPGEHTLSVNASADCGDGPSRNIKVNVNNVPAAPALISGEENICIGNTANYSIPAVEGVSYAWNLQSGGKISGSGNKITVEWGEEGTHILSVSPANACGEGAASNLTVTVTNDIPPQPGEIQGAENVCIGESPYRVEPVDGVGYDWKLSGGGTIKGSGNEITVKWNEIGTHTLTLTPSAGCGEGTAHSLVVTVGEAPVQPGAIEGENDVCVGTQTYRVDEMEGVQFVWSLSEGGTIIGEGHEIEVNWTEGGPHTISVSVVADCGEGSTQSMKVNVTDNPILPLSITGPDKICEGSSADYSIPELAGIFYTWALESGGNITSGSGHAITINWQTKGIHNLKLTLANECGSSETLTLPVQVENLPPPPAAITGDNHVCAGTFTYSIENTDDNIYRWFLAEGGELLDTAGQNIQVNWTTPGTYQLSVMAENSCGTGSMQSLEVQVNEKPETPLIIADGLTLTSSEANGNQWYFNGLLIEGATTQTYEALPINGLFTVQVTESCGASDLSAPVDMLITATLLPEAATEAKIYPNPAAEQVVIEIPVTLAKGKILIIDAHGHTVLAESFENENRRKLDVYSLGQGIYFIKILTENTVITKKLLIQR